MSMTDSDWVLVQFKPNSDGVACRNLIRQGFELFLPKIEVTARASTKFVRSLKPLFPGYLFAKVDLRVGGWRAINSTYGVSRIVTTAGKPTPVPAGLVNELKARCDDCGTVQPEAEFDVGDTVQLRHGPFANWIGKIMSLPDQQRAWVLLDIMGGQTRVAVNQRDLAAV